MTWCRRAAELGSVDAQIIIGNAYARGGSLEKDEDQAEKFLEMAAAQDHPKAFYSLGRFYEQKGDEGEYKEQALEYYQRAADLGDTDARAAIERLTN